MYSGQVLIATEREVVFHKQVEAGKIYIIDFDTSKRFERGPGHQHAIDMPECAYKPPLGMTRFDPYSWDVYCTGMLFEYISKVALSCTMAVHLANAWFSSSTGRAPYLGSCGDT